MGTDAGQATGVGQLPDPGSVTPVDPLQGVVSEMQGLLSMLPRPFQWAIFGQDIGDMDFLGMRLIEAAWRVAEAGFMQVAEWVGAAAAGTGEAINREEFSGAGHQLADAARANSEYCGSIAEQCGNSTTESQKAFIEAVLFALMTFYQILAMSTNGATSIFAIAKLAEARRVYLEMLEKLVAKTGWAGGRAAAYRATLHLALPTATFSTLNAGIDLGVQAWQKYGAGTRDSIDLKSVAAMAAMGAGAVPGGYLGAAAARALLPQTTNRLLGTAVKYGIPMVAGATGVIGGAAAAFAVTGHFDIDELLPGLVSGTALGLAGARAYHPEGGLPSDVVATVPDIALDPSTLPDMAMASHEALRDWAASLPPERARQLLRETTADAAAQLNAGHGELPSGTDMVGTTRKLTALVEAQSRRFMENEPPWPIPHDPAGFEAARENLAGRVPEARELQRAANIVNRMIEAFPAGVGRLEGMPDFPDHLNMVVGQLEHSTATTSIGRPMQERHDALTAAVRTMRETWHYFDSMTSTRQPDNMLWAEQVDDILTGRSESTTLPPPVDTTQSQERHEPSSDMSSSDVSALLRDASVEAGDRDLLADATDADDVNSDIPDLDAPHDTLTEWAGQLSPERLRDLMTETNAIITEQLTAFQRGRPGHVIDMVEAARVQNVLVHERAARLVLNEQARRLGEPPIPEDAASFEAIQRAFADRIPEVRELHAAARNLYDAVGALPPDVVAGLRPPSAGDYWARDPAVLLTELHGLPEHLGRMIDSLERGTGAALGLDLYAAGEHIPTGQERDMLMAAADDIVHLGSFLDGAHEPWSSHFDSDGKSWSDYVEDYLLMQSGGGDAFERTVFGELWSLDRLTPDYLMAREAGNQVFAGAAGPQLRSLMVAAEYFMARTRDSATALDLVRRADELLVTAAFRMPDSEAARHASRVMSQLHDNFARAEQYLPKSDLPREMRRLWRELSSNGDAVAAIGRVPDELGRMARDEAGNVVRRSEADTGEVPVVDDPDSFDLGTQPRIERGRRGPTWDEGALARLGDIEPFQVLQVLGSEHRLGVGFTLPDGRRGVAVWGVDNDGNPLIVPLLHEEVGKPPSIIYGAARMTSQQHEGFTRWRIERRRKMEGDNDDE